MGSATGFHVRVLVQGELGPTWSAMFSDLAVEPVSVTTTLIHGEVPDQAALHGLLAAIRDFGLSLISVEAGVNCWRALHLVELAGEEGFEPSIP